MTDPNDPIGINAKEVFIPSVGLTKREYFAAMAMQGLCANRSGRTYSVRVDLAVKHADALIAVLNK